LAATTDSDFTTTGPAPLRGRVSVVSLFLVVACGGGGPEDLDALAERLVPPTSP